jgi:hypothetical protein
MVNHNKATYFSIHDIITYIITKDTTWCKLYFMMHLVGAKLQHGLTERHVLTVQAWCIYFTYGPVVLSKSCDQLLCWNNYLACQLSIWDIYIGNNGGEVRGLRLESCKGQWNLFGYAIVFLRYCEWMVHLLFACITKRA